jgi:hypothetical protein
MKPTPPSDSELISLLRAQLGFSDRAVIRPKSTFRDSYPILFDLIIEDAAKTYIVELKRVVRLDSLSQLGFLKLLLKDSAFSTCDITFVMAGKRITPDAIDAAEKTGIQFIKLPANLNLRGPRQAQHRTRETHIPQVLAGYLTSPQDEGGFHPAAFN